VGGSSSRLRRARPMTHSPPLLREDLPSGGACRLEMRVASYWVLAVRGIRAVLLYFRELNRGKTAARWWYEFKERPEPEFRRSQLSVVQIYCRLTTAPCGTQYPIENGFSDKSFFVRFFVDWNGCSIFVLRFEQL